MDIELLEGFAFAEDREAAVAQLIPGSEEHYYYAALLAQQRGELDKADKLIESWRKKQRHSSGLATIEARQMSLRLETPSAELTDELRRRLNLDFTHQREVELARGAHPTTLPDEATNPDVLTAQSRVHYPGSSQGFTNRGLRLLLDRTDLDHGTRQHMLSRLSSPDHPRIAEHVAADINERHTSFGSLQIHRLLLPEQLDELARRIPSLQSDPAFVEVRLTHLQPNPDEPWRIDADLKRAYLDRLLGAIKDLGPAFNSLRAHVLYHRLDLGRETGEFPRGLFHDYLRTPRSASYLATTYRRAHRDNIGELGQSFHHVTLLDTVGSDEELVRAYLEVILADSDDFGSLAELIDKRVLRRWFAELKILAGTGDLERWHQLYSDDQGFASLRDRVDIDLDTSNPKRYAEGEPIVISARIKNVKTLVVNVFEINAQNYALKVGRLPDASIDLDGMVASETATHEYDEPPFKRVTRKFEMPELSRPGVYVIELIGGGKSSRAVIRVGGLRTTERIGSAGHVLSVFDEQNRPVTDAVMYIGGSEFAADDRGEIRVPFSTQPRQQNAVVCGAGRVEVISFHHASERYTLSAGVFIARETMVAGATATAIIRPTLRVAGTRIPLTLLEEAVVEITTTDQRGITAKRELRELDLASDDDLTGEFRVPENLASVSIALRGRVRSVSEQTDVELSDSAHVAINGIDASEHIDALHLGRTDDGHVIFALGKNGEPRADLALAIAMRHRDYLDVIETTLQTDENGCAFLPRTDEFSGVSARAPSGVSGRWAIGQPLASVPAEVHAAVGETVVIADAESSFSILERRGNGFVSDRTSAGRWQGAALLVDGLGAGDYLLTFHRTLRTVELRVAEGERRHGYISNRRRTLELRGTAGPRLDAIEPSHAGVRIAVSGATERTRVHVEATRFLDWQTPWSGLGASASPRRLRRGDQPIDENHYVSGRDLGDELRYVLERRLAEKLPGAAVARPGLLLNPWARDATDTDTLTGGAGGAYGARAASAPAPAMAPARPAPQSRAASDGAFVNLDFLEHPAAVWTNLVVKDGSVELHGDGLANASALRVLVVDGDFAMSREITLPDPGLECRDLRLDEPFAADSTVCQLRDVSELLADEALVVRDIASSSVEVVDNVARVHSLFCSLSGNPTMTEFSFVTRWPSLEDAERAELYSKYACHELHLFLREKDRPFFDEVIEPYLRDKHHKTFLDEYFIGADLERFLEPWRYGRLNTLERILLAGRLGILETVGNRVRDDVELRPRDLAAEKALFDAVIGGGALADDTLGFADAAKAIKSERRRERAKKKMAKGGPPPGAAPMALAAPEPAAEMAFDEEWEGDDLSVAESSYAPEDMARDMRSRGDDRLFRAPERTREWAENNYYHLRPSQQVANLIEPNRFWLDYALRDPDRPFLSPHFAEATKNFSEMMAALAVLALPFSAEKHDVNYDGAQMNLEAKSEALVFHKQIAAVEEKQDAAPLLVSQNYFRADDRYRWEGGEQLEKYVTGEMLTHVVYLCQVVLTNPTSGPRKLQVLVQNPEGSMPVSGGTPVRGEPIELAPYTTQTLSYAFYFPKPGKFSHYGVQVTIDEELVASVDAATLDVVRTLSEVDTESWAHVSQHGDSDEVLAFLEKANLVRTDLGKIAWRMRDADMFTRALDLLDRHRVYAPILWAYSVYHGSPERMVEFLRHRDDWMSALGPEVGVGPLELEPVARGLYEHLEYSPLVNARAHRFGSGIKIANRGLEQQYFRALGRFCHLPALTDRHWLEVAIYMFAQDRVADGFAALDKVGAGCQGVQVDYMKAFAALAKGDLESADAIAERGRHHRVDRWRKRFEAVSGALARARGSEPIVSDEDDRRQAQDAMAAAQASLELAEEGSSIVVRHRGIERITVNVYLMDTELLFSRQPFMREATDRFAFIRPNQSKEVVLDGPDGEHTLDLEGHSRQNAIVEVVGGGLRRQVAHYAHELVVQVVERFGQLRVGSAGDGKPVVGAYVKVYARSRSGSVEFYKDGYSDLTGTFDYASISTDDLGSVERFALLLSDNERGSMIREVSPPVV